MQKYFNLLPNEIRPTPSTRAIPNPELDDDDDYTFKLNSENVWNDWQYYSVFDIYNVSAYFMHHTINCLSFSN